ncbi:MAG: GGDEF and EAL domain-containing protein [Hyphomicrobiaceae bacterium]|nr:GGDEF and EAL domain-containing protein [Hyphomicrobiaceae bacterium]
MANPQMTASPKNTTAKTNAKPADFSLNSIMTAAGETAYYWDLSSDKIVWAPNAPEILNVSDISVLRTGHGFQTLISQGLASPRRDLFLANKDCQKNQDAFFSIQYALGNDKDEKPVWFEDHGRLSPGPDGSPGIAKGVIRLISERYAKEQKLDFASRHDHLTGQINRGELWEAISDALLTSDKGENNYALMVVGINNLLMINEAFGFDTGDEVIAAVAKRMRKQLRDTDVLGRFASNKFGLLLEEASPAAMAGTAERLLRSIRNEVIETTLGPVAVTISIGGVLVPEQAKSVSEAMGFALEALAKAKAKPHDIFVAYAPTKGKKQTRLRNRQIADELIVALRHQRLVLALQPIVRATTLTPVIHECLLRIKKPNGEIISGGEYIPVAEQLGLIRLVDYRVLELAIDVAKYHPDMNLTINVSGLTATDNNWLELLRSLTNGDHTLTSRLIIEITETAAIQDIEESCLFVKRVKELGCRVAMDDFGTGYNSFRNLQILGIDMVKIDGSFIENMLENKDDQLFVRMLADLANAFDLEIVAECVGDAKTIDMLTEMGVTYLQGYHLGKPILALPEVYRNNNAE